MIEYLTHKAPYGPLVVFSIAIAVSALVHYLAEGYERGVVRSTIAVWGVFTAMVAIGAKYETGNGEAGLRPGAIFFSILPALLISLIVGVPFEIYRRRKMKKGKR